jgi:hypothetical protein
MFFSLATNLVLVFSMVPSLESGSFVAQRGLSIETRTVD